MSRFSDSPAGMTATAALALAAGRWGSRFGDRAALRRHQDRQLARFLRRTLPRAAFYWSWAGRPLADLPIVDKAAVLADFAAFNTRGVPLDRALAVALRAEESRDFSPTLDGLTVGLSSGTSGSRGVFLISPRERARWAGQLLARVLGAAALRRLLDVRRPPLRAALFLRANSNLYATVASRRLDFAFHDLLDGMEAHVRRLNDFRPHVLVAPPTVLRRLAEEMTSGTLRAGPDQVIAVAEVLEADDETAIGSAFGVAVQQVYQASEGFLGASCAEGRVHLNEELLHVEPEWLPGEEGRRFQPIITDFSRHTQLIVRYRLDDVLLLADGPCPCGRPSLSLAAIEGRADDVLWAAPNSGGWVPVFPDVLRRAFALADPAGTVRDYRLEQRGEAWCIRLAGAAAGGSVAVTDTDGSVAMAEGGGEGRETAAERAVRGELEKLAARQGFSLPPLRFAPWREPPLHEKRRRIRCRWRPGSGEGAAA